MQTRIQSLLEAKINLLASYPVTWIAYVWLAPLLFGVKVEHKQAVGFIIMFSVLSVIRQYAIRRVFVFLEKRREKL